MKKEISLKDIINMCGAGERLLVVGEDGELKLVVLGAESYYKLLHTPEVVLDPETINKKIIEAQLEEASKSTIEPLYKGPTHKVETKTVPEINKDIIAFGELDELIDPSFNFDPPSDRI
jgi:hypothetical protein